MSAMQWLLRAFDNNFSRILLAVQILFAWDLLTWSEAFGSTALATGKDLVGTSAVIAATAAAPLGLITLAVNKYMELRASQPVVVDDRRKAEEK